MKETLESYLHKYIPISQAMGIEVAHASQDKVILKAPCSNNINHKETVFGGSLHALATLSCWSLLHLNLSLTHAQAQIVITSSSVRYLIPVAEDFKAECVMVDSITWQRFIKMLEKKGKARLELSATIGDEKKVFVEYQGVFAAIRQ